VSDLVMVIGNAAIAVAFVALLLQGIRESWGPGEEDER
jgi:hypothetical protein